MKAEMVIEMILPQEVLSIFKEIRENCPSARISHITKDGVLVRAKTIGHFITWTGHNVSRDLKEAEKILKEVELRKMIQKKG